MPLPPPSQSRIASRRGRCLYRRGRNASGITSLIQSQQPNREERKKKETKSRTGQELKILERLTGGASVAVIYINWTKRGARKQEDKEEKATRQKRRPRMGGGALSFWPGCWAGPWFRWWRRLTVRTRCCPPRRRLNEPGHDESKKNRGLGRLSLSERLDFTGLINLVLFYS